MEKKKGTVTPLSSVFPPEEAQKASKRVQVAIDERRQLLSQLEGFVHDNVSLIKLVQKLPEDTHHNIMVPFGKAAFFPGRLIHTNEFMVLLGEGYYAERTCKQTTQILKRRGAALETQIESLKAVMKDLKAEASFFDATADESAEGLVEIREDYVEEDFFETSAGSKKTDSTRLEGSNQRAEDEDEEYMRIQMRMDELEKEEEVERADEPDDDEQIQNESNNTISRNFIDQEEVKSLPVKAPELPAVSKDGSSNPALKNSRNLDGKSNTIGRNVIDREEVRSSPVEARKVPAVSKECEFKGLFESSKALKLPQDDRKVEAPPTAHNTAFSTGAIIERPLSVGKQQTVSRGSKPVSRFMMQRKYSEET